MEYIRLTVEGPIAVVTIHRPACRNALNSQVYREIIAALQDVRDREDVRVVLLTGAGDKAFAAGADIAQMVQESPQSGRRLSALCHEAAELLEIFQWSGTDLECRDKLGRIREELADVLSYCVLMADVCGLDLDEILNAKVDQNAAKYPVEKARGSAAKYTELT